MEIDVYSDAVILKLFRINLNITQFFMKLDTFLMIMI